jgi:hypothetical protein
MNPNDEYSVRKEGPASAPAGKAGAGQTGEAGGPGPQWYVARPGGQREGPMTLDTLKQKAASGSVTGADMVWREGMPAWQPARDLLEVFRKAASGGPPPLPPLSADPGSRRSPADNEPWHMLPPGVERALRHAGFYRFVGRGCAVFALFGLLVSILTFYWQTVTLGWSLILGVGFLVGEAVATLLEKLERLESKAEQPAPTKGTFSDTPPVMR